MHNQRSNPHRRAMREATDEELHRRLGAYVPDSDRFTAAKVELERRERMRGFWRRDIVAWLALFLSVVSLVVSITNRR